MKNHGISWTEFLAISKNFFPIKKALPEKIILMILISFR